MNSNNENSPLPYGWIRETHESGHPYYVDTKAKPPRSIWVHPYDDEQYLQDHPDAREKVQPPRYTSSLAVPTYNGKHGRRHSYNGHGRSSRASSASSASSEKHPKRRGLIGTLKDKAIGTKEERRAEKRRNDELRAQQQQQRMADQATYMQQNQYATPYGQPHRMGGMGGMNGMGGMGGMSSMGGMGRRGGGMGGMALPLMGGMAGGLLLGDMMDGGFNDNNFGGGGGFDGGGGDFGGGDFGGGF